MKSIIKIAILTFLLRNSISGKKGMSRDCSEDFELDWLANAIADENDDDFVKWFVAEKMMDTESVSMNGRNLVQVWLPVKIMKDKYYDFMYFNN